MDYQHSGVGSLVPASSSSSLAPTSSWTTPPRDPSSSFMDEAYSSGSKNAPAGRQCHCNTSDGCSGFTSVDTYGTQRCGNGVGLAPSFSHYPEDGWEHDGDTLGGDGDGGFQLYRTMEREHSEGQDVMMQDNGKPVF